MVCMRKFEQLASAIKVSFPPAQLLFAQFSDPGCKARTQLIYKIKQEKKNNLYSISGSPSMATAKWLPCKLSLSSLTITLSWRQAMVVGLRVSSFLNISSFDPPYLNSQVFKRAVSFKKKIKRCIIVSKNEQFDRWYTPGYFCDHFLVFSLIWCHDRLSVSCKWYGLFSYLKDNKYLNKVMLQRIANRFKIFKFQAL